MLTHSTVESVEARQPTWLAIFETVISILIYALIAWKYQTYVHFVVAAIFAPLFLLRTKESTEWLHLRYFESYLAIGKLFDDMARRIHGSRENFFRSFLDFLIVILFIVPLRFFTILMAGFFLRFLSLVLSSLVRPLVSLKSIPGNLFEQMFCVDVAFLPEFMPGENLRSKKTSHPAFQMFGIILKGIWKSFNNRSFVVVVFGLLVAVFITFLPIFLMYGVSLFYRIGFKSTSILYFPIVWVSSVGLNDGRPAYERLSRFKDGEWEKLRRWASGAAAPIVALKIVVMFGFADRSAVVEKLVETSWLAFLRPSLEQFLSPGFMVWWAAAITVEIVLTFVLFFFADAAIARKDGAKPWSESRVEAIASALITLRSAVAVLLVCSAVAFAVSAYVKTL